MLKIYTFFLIFSFAFLQYSECQNPNPPLPKQIPDPRLRKKLLEGYDRHAVPLSNRGKGTVLKLPSMTITHFDIKEEDQLFEIDAWLEFNWVDERLRWSYGDDTGTLHFAPDEIWVPDLVLYNSGEPGRIFIEAKSDCLITSNGLVTWIPPYRMSAYCKLNLLQWPRDSQKCLLKFGSWTYSELEMDLEFGTLDEGQKVKVFEEYTMDNTEWDVLETNAFRESRKYNCCAENYVSITYEFTLIRKSNNYSYTVCLPVALFSVINLLCFFLPISSGERITLSGINLVVNSVFMIFFRNRLPTTDHVPYIVMFYGWNLILATINIVTAILLTNMAKWTREDWIPKYLDVTAYPKLISILRLDHLLAGGDASSHEDSKGDGKEGGQGNANQNKAAEELILSFDDSPQPTTTTSGPPQPSAGGGGGCNWALLAGVIDRLSFCAYTIITLFLAIIFA